MFKIKRRVERSKRDQAIIDKLTEAVEEAARQARTLTESYGKAAAHFEDILAAMREEQSHV